MSARPRTPEQRAAKAAYYREYRARPSVKAAMAAREATPAYKEVRAAYASSSKARAKWSDARLRNRYGLTADAYEVMLLAQSGRCAACTDPMTTPQVDHSHDTGRVRELLCGDCNTSAGRLRDDPSRCHALGDYLERHAA